MHALSPIALPPAELAAKRKRARNTLIAGVALGSTGHIAAVTVGTIVAHELIGTQALAGAPGATVVLGAALGAVLLSALMARRGRRMGLVSGYSIGVVGAFVATAAVLTRSFPLLLLGTMLIGFGNAANNLSRYTAADMVKTDRRASAIGTVVWASTVGSVIGPTLVPIAGEIALQAGLPPLAGPYLVPVVFVGLAAILSFIFLRPDPYELADEDAVALAVPGDTTTQRVWSIMRRPGVFAAIIALVVSQTVMVLIMTMTPLHMTEHGHSLAEVGIVLSAHTLGMFALSPLSGWLTERFGAVPTIFLGSATLGIAALMAAAAPADGGADPRPRAVPAGPGLELRVRRGLGAPVAAPRAPRADAGPGRGRRAHLVVGGRGQPRVGADHGGRRLHGAGDPRGGGGDHPRARPARPSALGA